MEAIAVGSVYEIGPFRLEPGAGVLLHAGVPMPLGPRAIAVLTALVERPNEYVQKATIMDVAWPGLVVEENNLSVQISAIRRVLARAPGGEAWVETLPRRGYRFVGPTTELQDNVLRVPRSEAGRSNLPHPATSFVGRERELVEAKQLLPTVRLLTLVGVGGIGKTRMAVQLAHEVIDAYRDGAWLAELGAISDPALVATAVVRSCGLRLDAQKPAVEVLCRHVRSRQLLLLLDNCEHVLGACWELASALLAAGAGLTIIATSREPLRIPGEHVYSLRSLSLPPPEASLEVVAAADSVQLFMDRARAAGPCFGLSANASTAAICRRLDGIPLAIEMAAARAPTLGVEKLAQKLEESFRLLTLGWRSSLPRQQTLRATLDWSYGLLAERERTVLRRASVFRGSFSLEAVCSIAADEESDEFEVADLLSQLVARSLVVAELNEGRTRYRLLDIIRAYGFEKLDEAREAGTILRRHAEYFRGLLRDAWADWFRMSDARWYGIYAIELDNVRSALDWAMSPRGDRPIAVALAGSSGQLWFSLSLRPEARQRLDAAAPLVSPHTPESEQRDIWYSLGLACFHAAPREAVELFERAVALNRTLGDKLGLTMSLADLAASLAFTGRFDQANSALQEASPLVELLALPRAIGKHEAAWAFVQTLNGDPKSALPHYEKALVEYRRGEAERDAVGMLINVAHVTWALGSLDQAVERCLEAVEIIRRAQPIDHYQLGFTLAYLVGIHTERGEIERAMLAARESLPMLSEIGCAWNILDDFALLAAMAGNIGGAARAIGYTDATYKASAAARPPHVAQSRLKTETLLLEKLSPEMLERLVAEGATMTEDEACRALLEPEAVE
jgi:predicted ATPase/DNA-binding winged helix-turn-helix (wHTH) protein